MDSTKNNGGPIYLIGGAPRAGKSTLGQQVAEKLSIGWISTDTLFDILQVKQVPPIQKEWDASPEAIAASASWFYPCLERFVWGIQSLSRSGSYLIEGVDILPAQVLQLSEQFNIRSLFLGRSHLTLEQFDKYPGRSVGYSFLPEEQRKQIVNDVPKWSKFVQSEAEKLNCPYVDMSGSFSQCLVEAEKHLIF